MPKLVGDVAEIGNEKARLAGFWGMNERCRLATLELNQFGVINALVA